MIHTKLTSWQPPEDILRAITAANKCSTSTAAVCPFFQTTSSSQFPLTHSLSLTTERHPHQMRTHCILSLHTPQHLPESDSRLQSTLLPSDSYSSSSSTSPEVVNTVVAHSYHIFLVIRDSPEFDGLGGPWGPIRGEGWGRGRRGGFGYLMLRKMGLGLGGRGGWERGRGQFIVPRD